MQWRETRECNPTHFYNVKSLFFIVTQLSTTVILDFTAMLPNALLAWFFYVWTWSGTIYFSFTAGVVPLLSIYKKEKFCIRSLIFFFFCAYLVPEERRWQVVNQGFLLDETKKLVPFVERRSRVWWRLGTWILSWEEARSLRVLGRELHYLPMVTSAWPALASGYRWWRSVSQWFKVASTMPVNVLGRWTVNPRGIRRTNSVTISSTIISSLIVPSSRFLSLHLLSRL